ncbi:hypothetical protein GCM10027440_39870 [Nocardiopsis coralliicola]
MSSAVFPFRARAVCARNGRGCRAAGGKGRTAPHRPRHRAATARCAVAAGGLQQGAQKSDAASRCRPAAL